MYKDRPWMELITKDNLPNEDLKILESVIGIEKTRLLMVEMPGISFSIPKNCLVPAKMEYISQHYDGTKSTRIKLAKMCELSESYICKAIRKKNAEK